MPVDELREGEGRGGDGEPELLDLVAADRPVVRGVVTEEGGHGPIDVDAGGLAADLSA